MENEDVGRGELLGGGESISTGGDGAPGVEQRGPLGEKARVVVGAGAVGFRARTDEDAERRLNRGDGREGGEGSGYSEDDEEGEGEGVVQGEFFSR